VLAVRRRLTGDGQSLAVLERRLARVHPGAVLRQHAQRLDELESRMKLALRSRLNHQAARHDAARGALLRASPLLRLAALRLRLEGAAQRLRVAARDSVGENRRRFELAMRTLDAVSPLATLGRGYAIVTDAAGHVLQDATAVQPGQRVTARLARGGFRAEVIERLPEPASPKDES